jgi:hypothetical protein
MDFGRISFRNQLVLYLFGTPGQERFWFMWDDLALGAIGAVVLADTRRIGDCFASIDYFERAGVPFIIAVTCFDGAPRFEPADIRIALTLSPEIPIVLCDARVAESVKVVLISLVRHVMTRQRLNTASRLSGDGATVAGAARGHAHGVGHVVGLVEVPHAGGDVGHFQARPDPLGVPIVEDGVDGSGEVGAVPRGDDDEAVATRQDRPVQRAVLRAEHVHRVVRVLELNQRLGVPS